MPHAEYPCDGAGRYPQSAMHCFMPTGYAGVYPHASSYPGMPHGYGYGCGPLEMMPGAALGHPGLGYSCYPDSLVRPCATMVGPSAAGDEEAGDEEKIALTLQAEMNQSHKSFEDLVQQVQKQLAESQNIHNERKIMAWVEYQTEFIARRSSTIRDNMIIRDSVSDYMRRRYGGRWTQNFVRWCKNYKPSNTPMHSSAEK